MDATFSLDSNFRAIWYKHYSGQNAGLIDQVKLLIRDGGYGYATHLGFKINVTKINQFQFNHYNTLILDGTSIIDMEYAASKDVCLLEMPEGLRSYENLTFHLAEVNMGKATRLKKPELLELITGEIAKITKADKTLVLCRKDSREMIELILADQITAGRVMINHYGNVKGSNQYADCTALVLVGILHKGDPFYISKYSALHGTPEDIECGTPNYIRRFRELGLERVKLNDQVTGMIQDICRIAIRNSGNKSPIKVFIPHKDHLLGKLLVESFRGSTLIEWRIEALQESAPEWYDIISGIFGGLDIGEEVSKKAIKEMLGLDGEGGDKQLQRIQKQELYHHLLKENGIVTLNNRKYRKEKGVIR